MHLYSYDGPVMQFNRCVADHWKAETIAPTEKKARSNLAYRYKQSAGLVTRTTVTLPGKIKKED